MSLETMEQREGMKKRAQELIEQAYQRGYKAGYSKAETDYHEQTEKDRQSSYEFGLNEAWEAAKKIVLGPSEGGLPGSAINEYFDVPYYYNVLSKYSASEAIAKIKAYEEQKKQEEDEIKVGDEVRLVANREVAGIVTQIDYQNKVIWVMSKNGKQWIGASPNPEKWEKTGRHFDEIAEVLEKMQEG